MKKYFLLLFLPLLLVSCNRDYSRKGGLVSIPCGESVIRLQVISPSIVRVTSVPDGRFSDRKSLAVVGQPGYTDYDVTAAGGKVRLATDSLVVEVYKASGTMNFFKGDGTPLLQDGSFAFSPIEVEGKKAWSVRTTFEPDPEESFYGLGQHQAGEFDHKGRNEELYQYNTKVSVPVIVRSLV